MVYAIRGSFGAVEQVPADLDGVNLSRDAARIAPSPHVNARWLMYALKSHVAQEQFRRKEVGAMVTGVNISDLKQVKVPVPPNPDQDVIVRSLDELRAKLDRLTNALRQQMNLLAEHRQALMTAAVTGALDIPGVAA